MLSFFPPSCNIDPNFWETLYHRKINIYRLDDSEQPIVASLSYDGSFSLDGSSFIERTESGHAYSTVGKILSFNLPTGFKELDKKQYLQDIAGTIIDNIVDGSAIQNPRLLNKFALIVYPDLKSYKFTFWFGQPALVLSAEYRLSVEPHILKHSTVISGEDTIKAINRCIFSAPSESVSSLLSDGVFALSRADSSPSWTVVTLQAAWVHRFDTENTIIVVVEPLSPGSSPNAHSWKMRNVLFLLNSSVVSGQQSAVNVLAWRSPNVNRFFGSILPHAHPAAIQTAERLACEAVGRLSDSELVTQDESILFQITLTNASEGLLEEKQATLSRVVGWAPNDKGRSVPRTADLSALLDSRRLAAQAMDLNLRLMKWRLWPSLDTEAVAGTRCLLLGAGTLGCAVARSLLGWGVKKITFVDNGTVSYSNPARQCLFELKDCEERRYKSVAAAAALKRIFPDVDAQAVVMTIPMPGHPFTAEQSTSAATPRADETWQSYSTEREAASALEALVCSHDVVFALTDSREARWLPTVLCAAHDKILINAALGFDTYLVMRHGHGVAPTQQAEESTSHPRLGCYFCSDIVAAVNSQKDRTLDQQCTVTRPGLSFISSAIAVELMVTVLQSPLRNRHPSELALLEGGTAAEGVEYIPHQLRGSVRNFTHYNPAIPAFSACTACSLPIVNQYRQEGLSFVERVCADTTGKYLEDLSGISELTRSIDLNDCDLEDWDEDEDDAEVEAAAAADDE